MTEREAPVRDCEDCWGEHYFTAASLPRQHQIMAALESLTEAQRTALGQLQSITNGADIDAEIGVLSSVGWDVQVGNNIMHPFCTGVVVVAYSHQLSCRVPQIQYSTLRIRLSTSRLDVLGALQN